jgi:uncharacterized protein (TIGR03437 family)
MNKSRTGLRLGLILACAALAAHAQDFRLTAMQQIVASPYGGRAAWSHGPNNVIAYDSINTTTGFYDVWTMNPDGSNKICLTCNWEPPPLVGFSNPQPYYNKGNPDWDPTGQYIVFEVQRNDTTYTAAENMNSRPGLGVNDFIYIMDAAGKNYWPVAASEAYTAHNGGALEPKFSHNTSSRGEMIAWGQLIANGTGAFDGDWELKVASFTVVNGAPQVTLLYTGAPGGGAQCTGPFYEPDGFSLDDSTVFYAGNPSEGCSGPIVGYDQYSFNLNTQALVNLNSTPGSWDEQGRPHPTLNKLLYISSYGLDSTLLNLVQEYWTMNYDGSDKKKITWLTDSRGQFFNATIPDFYVPSVVSVGPCDWSPNGLQAILYFPDKAASGQSAFGQTGSIWELTVELSSTTESTASYVNYPQAPSSISVSFGNNLGVGQNSATTVETNLAGTTVTVQDAQGASRPANVFFENAKQVNWQVPPATAPGPALVTTTSADGAQTTDFFDVENVAPGLYTANSSAAGPAAAYLQPGNAFTFTCPTAATCTTVPINVSSGQTYLILFGTGVRNHANPVTISFTNQAGTMVLSQTAEFAGAEGLDAGLDQINVLLPVSLEGSGLLNVALTVDGRVSNAGQVSIQ